jgi:hypothetical protein
MTSAGAMGRDDLYPWLHPGVGGGGPAARRSSPPLDKAGNSGRAQAAITQIGHTLKLGLVNT